MPPLTARSAHIGAAVVAAGVACVIAATLPYTILRLGYGPNVSLMSTFCGFLLWRAWQACGGGRPDAARLTLAQSAGTAAGAVGFMSVFFVTVDLLAERNGTIPQTTPLMMFVWLAAAGILGTLVASFMTHPYVVIERLPFAGGVAAAEAIEVLIASSREVSRRIRQLGAGLLVSASIALARASFGVEALFPWKTLETYRVGFGLSPLALGAGMLVGPRIALSMLLGLILGWIVLPEQLVSRGVAASSFGDVVKWVMWPAASMTLSAGVCALVLKRDVIGRSLVQATEALSTSPRGSTKAWRLSGLLALVAVVALEVLCVSTLSLPLWFVPLAVVVALPFVLIGGRILGETNYAPITTLATVAQLIAMAVCSSMPNVALMASGLCAAMSGVGWHLLQNQRAAQHNRVAIDRVVPIQLGAVVVAAATVAVVYPFLRTTWGFGDGKLSSPISMKWLAFTEVLSTGGSALPHGALEATVVCAVAGVVLSIFESRSAAVPSPTAVAMGLLIPGTVVLPMVLGAVLQHLWTLLGQREKNDLHPLASGLIAGEALIASLGPAIPKIVNR
jgi:uncharacterized oligopeptide transporter (OPT) family protein